MYYNYRTTRPWTDDEVAFVRQWYGTLCHYIIAYKLERTPQQIRWLFMREIVKRYDKQSPPLVNYRR